jgi:uridine phosphorylase
VKQIPPILRKKTHGAPSLFVPANLLREARRQKCIPDTPVPEVCILDPDGDIVRHLLSSGRAVRNANWPCYHTRLYNFTYEDNEFGIVGYAVGAPFAVLVAEELFASGCCLLLSVTSAGQITPVAQDPPFFVLIDRALRDEGTSYHYLPASDYAEMAETLQHIIRENLSSFSMPVYLGAAWTTDAPFRETEDAIRYARSQDIIAVEMEAAALYAFARARQKPVVCVAHVTNQMGMEKGDFEKGEQGGYREALDLLTMLSRKIRSGI